MFIEVNKVLYDSRIHRYTTDKMLIKSTSIVSVTDDNEYIGSYECRKIDLDNGKVIYTTDSYKSIVNRMNTITNLLREKGETKDE